VTHLQPRTSKWNKIEHRLFAFITMNWRGKPLVNQSGHRPTYRLDERRNRPQLDHLA
jgi:Rhodopirellula transposase DDE domain